MSLGLSPRPAPDSIAGRSRHPPRAIRQSLQRFAGLRRFRHAALLRPDYRRIVHPAPPSTPGRATLSRVGIPGVAGLVHTGSRHDHDGVIPVQNPNDLAWAADRAGRCAGVFLVEPPKALTLLTTDAHGWTRI